MEIVFEKKDSAWVSEFEATGDFALHIEGVLEGNVRVYQSTVKGGGYAFVRGSAPYPTYGDVYDFTFTDLVYPKWIKVECATQPTKASVISNGEISPSGGGGDEWRYYTGNVMAAGPIAFLVGVIINGDYLVVTPSLAHSHKDNWKTIAVNYDAKFSITNATPRTLDEMIALEGGTRQEMEASMGLVEITEEQFYNYQ